MPLAEALGARWTGSGGLNRAEESTSAQEPSRPLLWLIPARALVVFLCLNLAEPLGILPERLGSLPFVPFFNTLSITLTLAYLAWWWNGKHVLLQLYVQIGLDLFLTSVLVAQTRGLESPFASFFLLIIIYCSLTLGRRGAIVSAAVSATLFSVVAAAADLGLLRGQAASQVDNLSFRISLNVLGFISVAFLGTYLSQRLQKVQQQLEEKIDSLKQLQKLNDLIVSSIRSGLVTTDLTGEITLFNNTAEELTGRARLDVLRKSMREVFGDDFWHRICAADLIRNPRPLRYENWVDLSCRMRRFLGCSVSPLLDHQRRMIGYIISFQDLTDMKQLEEEIRLKDRLATVGRMAAGIAHEIRNPLTSMRGSAEILRSHADLPKSDQRLLDILMRESDRLNQFVEDLLCFARPGKYTRQSMDLIPLLRDSATLLRNSPEIRDKHTVRLELDSERVAVMGNADKLQQVFWNLSQNALRAMPDGGILTIRAGLAEDGGGRVVFEDTGIGMAPDEQSNLYQPFNSGFSAGTGLGLSIVFQILEDHGGRIQFESEKGKGTHVTLHLPPAHENVATR